MSRANDAAFPVPPHCGLTIREHFAAMAMQGILAGCHPITKQAGAEQLVADAAVGFADALIQELGRAHG